MDPTLERLCFNIYYSDFILENIVKNLDLNEQAKLLQISKRFQYILTSFIWPKYYTRLQIYKTPYFNIISPIEECQNQRKYIEFQEVNTAKVALNHEESNSFLRLNAQNIEHLKVNSEYYCYIQEMGVSFKCINRFPNLVELTYYRLILTDDHLLKIANGCKQLKKLHLIECYNEYLNPLIPGEHINLANICEMKQLQDLELHADPAEESVMKSYHLQELFVNLKLKKLILKNFVIDDNDSDTLRTINNSLEVLDMGMISISFWPSFMHYLNHFSKLRELWINVSDCNTTFNVQVIDILARKCPYLEKLYLEKCDLCVGDFGVLKNLQHLSLTSCGSLTFSNFQQILGALKLKTFALIDTRIYGEINHIYISPTLEKITIDTIRFTQISDAFQKSLNYFENLHTLEWLNGDINDNWVIEKCPKLKYLHIPNPYLLRRIVFTVKGLKELTFTSCKGLSWCFILILIRNLELNRLCLKTQDIIDDHKEVPGNSCNIETTLKWITLPFGIFKMAQFFWLDLLHLNLDLHYSIYGRHEEILDAKFLEDLTQDEKFGLRVKKIDICGFRLDCADLRNDFNNVIHQVNKCTSLYRFKNNHFVMEI